MISYGVTRKRSTLGQSPLEAQAGCSAIKSPQRFVQCDYGVNATKISQFNHVNGLQLIARAHQLVNEGYKVRCSPVDSEDRTDHLQYHFKDKDVVTVWSAPNYCYRCGNVASIMNLGEDLKPDFQIFSAVPDHRRAVPAGRGTRGEYFL